MDARQLPARPSLEQYRKQAKDLVQAYNAGESAAIERIANYHPHSGRFLDSAHLKARFGLADAQLIIAREHGVESWPRFRERIKTLLAPASAQGQNDPVSAFLEAASVPLDAGHTSGTLAGAEAILAAHPELATQNIFTAAALGEDVAVRRLLTAATHRATAKGGPRGWDPLTYLCFSRYLRLDHSRSDGFVRVATALLDAGASANTGFYEARHQPAPQFESVLYGAAGIAHHPELTQLLIARGADVNDEEVTYHCPETYDNRALKILVASGKLHPDGLATMLVRKHDMHDYDGAKWLLEHGSDPNRMTRWGRTALHHAVLRDNAKEMIEALLDHAADPTLLANGKSGLAMAARRGRGDLLELFAERGIPLPTSGVDGLIAACAVNDTEQARTIAAREPELVRDLRAEGGKLLAEFSGAGNTEGVRQLLDLGIPVDVRFTDGDGYWGLAKESTALHVAAWRARHPVVKLLIERKAPVNVPDGKGRTPLALAVRACVDSYWTELRSPESVKALLNAGASTDGVDFPSGYAEVDDLLRQYAGG